MFGAEDAGIVEFALPPFWVIAVILVLYVVTVYGIKYYVHKTKKVIRVRTYLVIHNFTLSIISLGIVVWFLQYFVPNYYDASIYQMYCGVRNFEVDKHMGVFAYVFWLTKFMELIDTVVLALRDKPITFLHIYHHILVIIVGWTSLNEFVFMGWLSAITNASVHVVMYYYFGLRALYPEKRIWWRKYVTKIQILQFISDGLTATPFLFLYLTKTPCRGSFRAWVLAYSFGWSLLYLFMDFYKKSYQARQSKSKTS